MDFNFDLERNRKHINGAEKMELVFEINPSHLKSDVDESVFTVHDTVLEKLLSETITVEFPEDI